MADNIDIETPGADETDLRLSMGALVAPTIIDVDNLDTPIPVITGTSPPYARVEVRVNGQVDGYATANIAGQWTYTLTGKLNGEYNIIAYVVPGSAPYPITIASTTQPATTPSGVPAYIEYDPARSAFYVNSVPAPSETDFWSALGASDVGATKRIGPYMDPTDTNLIANSALADTTGWAVGNSMAIAAVAGELVGTPTGNLSWTSYALTGLANECLRFRYSLRRGTATTMSFQAIASINNNGLSSGNSGPSVSGTPVVDGDIYLGIGDAGNAWLGFRCTSSAGDGTTGIMSDVSGVKAWPAQNWARNSRLIKYKNTTPSSFASKKVAYQEDDGGERERIRLEYDTSGHLHWIITTNNNTVADIDMGAYPVSTPFETAIRIQSNLVFASLNGLYFSIDITSSIPGTCFCRVGRSFTGEEWGSLPDHLVLFNSAETVDFVQDMASRSIANRIWTEGDSYVDGAYGVSLKASLATATGRLVINTAVGGSTLAQSVDRTLARPNLRGLTFVPWDGRNNSYGSVAQSLAAYDQQVQFLGHDRFLIPVPVSPSVSAPTGRPTVVEAVRDGLIAAYGAEHVLDTIPIMAGLATSPGDDAWVTYGYVPPSLMADGDHIIQSAMTAVAEAINTRLVANGW